jgi:hypothetical protein
VTDANGSGGAGGYVLFVWTPTGYELRDGQGDPPPVGHTFEDGGRALVVTKLGASPLPGDTRACVYTLGD